MKRSFTFFVLMLVVCGLFYFQKTKTQKENQVLVQGVVKLKEECDNRLNEVLEQKKECNAKLDELRGDIDKNNETISQNDSKIKNLMRNPRNKTSVEALKKKNEELKGEISEKNSEIELLNGKVDSFSNVESSLNDWRQRAFEILDKTQTGNLSKEDKVRLNAVSEEFKNLEKMLTEAAPAETKTVEVKVDEKADEVSTVKEEVKTEAKVEIKEQQVAVENEEEVKVESPASSEEEKTSEQDKK